VSTNKIKNLFAKNSYTCRKNENIFDRSLLRLVELRRGKEITGSETMNLEIASLMIQDENFIGALSLIAFFAGQIPGFLRLLRDSRTGCIMVDMTKKRK